MNNELKSFYKDALMKHFKHPYNKHVGEFPSGFRIARGRNPKCGDDIEVGIKFQSIQPFSLIEQVSFKGRGCSVCLASASMMVKTIESMDSEDVLSLSEKMQLWVDNKLENEKGIPEELLPLGAVKDHPARKKCVMLAWNALTEIIMDKMDSVA